MRPFGTARHPGPLAHRRIDALLWLLWLPPLACLPARLWTGSPDVAAVGAGLAVLAETAWAFLPVPYPGAWRLDLRAWPAGLAAVALPRPHTRWAGIEVQAAPDPAGPGEWRARIRFASGRMAELGPGDLRAGRARLDCDDEAGATLEIGGTPPLVLTAFEDPHAWKDRRAAWTLRRTARRWLLPAGAALALLLAALA